MKQQEMFETMARHLFHQGVPSREPDGLCRYRGPNGTRCPVGVVIPDEDYDEEMEGQDVFELFDDKRWRAALAPLRGHLHLLSRMQTVHDNAGVWLASHRLRSALMDIANGIKLNGCFLNDLEFSTPRSAL